MKKNNIINPLLNNLGEDVMGFLNEIQLTYPKAISLASGRPDENYFNLEDFSEHFEVYINSESVFQKRSRKKIINSLGHYSRTKGIINNLVAKYLKKDEKIITKPEDILLTVGTQEALVIAVITLCDRENEIIIVEDPTYIGITHFSMISGYKIEPIPTTNEGIQLKRLEERIIYYRKKGKKVKLVYVIPDYQNPTGYCMTLENRHQLLDMAQKYDFFILEDNAYGEFVYEGFKNLTLKALDINKRVIYLHSFSKVLYPSLRLAAMTTDCIIINEGKKVALSDLMAKTKGYITVNTPAINQAILGGILIKNEFSLEQMNKEKIACFKRKRNKLISSLNKFLNGSVVPWAKDISWNNPKGGFFITIKVPFKIDKKEVIYCAQNHQVIFTPMSFFYLKKGGDNEIRLAFSNIKDKEIEPAIKNLARYFKSKIINN